MKQSVSHSSPVVVGTAEREGEGDEEAAAADDDKHKDGDKVQSHHTKGDQKLRKVTIVIQNREQTWEKKHRIGGQDVVCNISQLVFCAIW